MIKAMPFKLLVAVVLVFVSYMTSAREAVTFSTSAGTIFVGPKSSEEADEYVWVVKVGNNVIKEMETDVIRPYVLGYPDLYEGKPAVIDTGDSISFIVNPATGGQACPGSDPFIVYLKKGEPAKTLDIPNNCDEISKLQIDGSKFVMTIAEHKANLVYENGVFLNKAPKNEPPKLTKSSPTYNADVSNVVKMTGIVTKGNFDRPFLKLAIPIKVIADCKKKVCDKEVAMDELYPSTESFDQKLTTLMGKKVTLEGVFFWPGSWQEPSLDVKKIIE